MTITVNHPKYRATIDGRGRYYVLDYATGKYVRNANGRNRWFYTYERAQRYAEALIRGTRRLAGYR